MRLLVFGGRKYGVAPFPATIRQVLAAAGERKRLKDFLSRLHAIRPITLIIHGGARGADTLAGAWAHNNSVPVQVFYAEWERLGDLAGGIRNGRMLREGRPNRAVGFPGGRGTADMHWRLREGKRIPFVMLEPCDAPQ